MAFPLLTLLTVLVQAVASTLTRPSLWLLVLGWLAISKFNFAVFASEVQQSIGELWWLVVIIAVTTICNAAIRAYLQGKRGQ